MAGPGLATNNDATYPDGATSDIKQHQIDHDTIATMLNRHDNVAVPADTTQVLFSTGSLYSPRNILSTDMPTVVTNVQTGTTYTLVLADAGKQVTLNNAASITLTIPTNASVAFPVNTIIMGLQLGAGQVTLAVAGGVTCTARGITPPIKAAGQYAPFTLQKVATDVWIASGDISA